MKRTARGLAFLYLVAFILLCGLAGGEDVDHRSAGAGQDLGKGWHPVFVRVRGTQLLLVWSDFSCTRVKEDHPWDLAVPGVRFYDATLSAVHVDDPVKPPAPVFHAVTVDDPWPEYDAFASGATVFVTHFAGIMHHAFSRRGFFRWRRGEHPAVRKPVEYGMLGVYDRFYEFAGAMSSQCQWHSLPPRGHSPEVYFYCEDGGDIIGHAMDGSAGYFVLNANMVENPAIQGAVSPNPFRIPDSSIGLLYASCGLPDDPYIGGEIGSVDRPLEGEAKTVHYRPSPAVSIQIRRAGDVKDLAAATPEQVFAGVHPERIRLAQPSAHTLWVLLVVRDGPANIFEPGGRYRYQGFVARSRDLGKTWTATKGVFSGEWHEVTADIAVHKGRVHVAYAGLSAAGKTEVHLCTWQKEALFEGPEEAEDRDDDEGGQDDRRDGDRLDNKRPPDGNDGKKGH